MRDRGRITNAAPVRNSCTTFVDIGDVRTTRPSRRTIALAMFIVASAAAPAFAHPGAGIVVDAKGRVFFVSTFANLVMMLDTNGKVRPFVTDPRLELPHHLVLGRDGSLYVASDHDGIVWRIGENGELTQFFSSAVTKGRTRILVGNSGNPFTIDSAGNILAVAGEASAPGIVRIDHGVVVPAALNAHFARLHYGAMAWGRDGALYTTDGSRVWRIRAESAQSIAAHPTPLNSAWGIVVDSAGNMYVADYGENRIVRLAPDGTINTPPALAAIRIAQPTGLALAHDGDLYVLGNPMGSVEVWQIRGGRKDRVYLARSPAALVRLGVWVALVLLVVVGIVSVANWKGRRM